MEDELWDEVQDEVTGADLREVDVLVVGAGQAGLATAHWLQTVPGLRVLVVDGAPVGQSWRDRWDSLQLFTPRHFSSLPGLRFPSGRSRSPSRLEMADYLQRYVAHFALPVQTGVRVDRLTRDGDRFTACTTTGATTGTVLARHVVLASGPFHRPFVPAAGDGLHPDVDQRHSYDYRRPSDLPPGDVLVVGGGNSAAQLAVELEATHRVTVASPGPLWYLPADVLKISVYWWLYVGRVLNASADAWISRYIRRRGDSIVGTELRELVRRGRVTLHPHRVVAGDDRAVTLEDQTVLPVSSVLWCTGFRPDTSWIDVAGAVDGDGEPVHRAGASPVPGLHWMGLPWQTRLNSSIIDGADRDARAVAARVASAEGLPAPQARTRSSLSPRMT